MVLDKVMKGKKEARDLDFQVKFHVSYLRNSMCAVKDTVFSCGHRLRFMKIKWGIAFCNRLN